MKKIINLTLVSLFFTGIIFNTNVFAEQAPVVDAFSQPAGVVSTGDSNQHRARAVQQIEQPITKQRMVSADDDRDVLNSRSASAMLLARINTLQQALQQMEGQLEIQRHEIKMLQEQQRTLYSSLEKRIAALPLKRSSGIRYTPDSKRKNVDARTNVDTRSEVNDYTNDIAASPRASKPKNQKFSARQNQNSDNKLQEQLIYRAAYKEIRARNFSQALNDFQLFVKQYPRSQYVPNAHYWIGELLLVKGDSAKAIQQFKTVVQESPKHPKAADSLLKLGLIYYDLKKLKPARCYWRRVTTQFPESNAARIAQTHLQHLARAGR